MARANDDACRACGSDDIEIEVYGVRCMTCGYVHCGTTWKAEQDREREWEP